MKTNGKEKRDVDSSAVMNDVIEMHMPYLCEQIQGQ